MITEQMKTRLAELSHSEYLWASQRANYMLSVIDQLEGRWITQGQVEAWMWDVIRRLNEDAGPDSEAQRSEIEALAQQLGELKI